MSEKTIVTDQAAEENSKSARVKQESETSRRNFLQQAIAAGSGLAICSMVPALARESWLTQRPNCDPAAGGQPLQSVMEIKSSGAGPTKTLKAVIKVLDEEKVYLGSPLTGQSAPSCNSGQMRYFSGYDASLPPLGRPVWPKTHGVPGPGPTLRASVGDTIQITLLNHVNTKNFPNTLDVAEHGQACDQNTTFGQGNTYPGTPPSQSNPTPSTPFFENPPNCFHGSSSTNLHFHGTHTSPSGISDNILLNIRPSPRGRDGLPSVNEKTVGPIFDKIFAYCMHGHQPLTSRVAGLAEAAPRRVRQHGDMVGSESTAGWTRSIGVAKRRTALVSEHGGNEGPPVAAVLHRRFPELLHDSEMEWPVK